jgi:hypothetical protein
LLVPIALNKNGQWSCKNLDVIIEVISLQLSKYVVGAIAFVKTRSIPPLEMGREAC